MESEPLDAKRLKLFEEILALLLVDALAVLRRREPEEPSAATSKTHPRSDPTPNDPLRGQSG